MNLAAVVVVVVIFFAYCNSYSGQMPSLSLSEYYLPSLLIHSPRPPSVLRFFNQYEVSGANRGRGRHFRPNRSSRRRRAAGTRVWARQIEKYESSFLFSPLRLNCQAMTEKSKCSFKKKKN